MRVDETTCTTTVHVRISPTFFGWLAQFGNRMRVLSPDTVVEQYKRHIKGIFADIEEKGAVKEK